MVARVAPAHACGGGKRRRGGLYPCLLPPRASGSAAASTPANALPPCSRRAAAQPPRPSSSGHPRRCLLLPRVRASWRRRPSSVAARAQGHGGPPAPDRWGSDQARRSGAGGSRRLDRGGAAPRAPQGRGPASQPYRLAPVCRLGFARQPRSRRDGQRRYLHGPPWLLRARPAAAGLSLPCGQLCERGVERVKVAAAPSASAVQKLIDRRSNKGRAGIAVRTP
ncbi:hypothetical protein PVAP13_4NG253911 [Panicum virgatum]|uniref:Uncharacterized protein n=1 Tax=Panicum virgatum TaxID=38727 RepID=A0A8T0TCT1_PANVG|nr:hypothetical protein PVAP13_4NG253911 [Panicum virgatum]